MKHNAYGIFDSYQNVNEAVRMLETRGFTSNDISMLASDHTRENVMGIEKSTKASEGAAAGGATGGVIGAIVAGLAAVATITIPGVGLLAAGPLVAALAGAGAGAAVGGLAGGLIGLGIPEHEAKFYEESVKEGGILLAVHAQDGEGTKTAKKILDACGALKVDSN